ncbi:MAG: ParB N-terminal domain-containing protein [Planctomycetes bacterium]|nr:ParB N-terminal domain-containing protein [Planctomycetota bacterium]
MKIRDRIREFRRVPASQLRPNPKNWRTHPPAQAEALRGLLGELGLVDAVLARQCEDGSLMLIDGHLRAETLVGENVPVLILDVTEAEADKVLLTLDPLAAQAEADTAKLDELLRDVQTGSDSVAALLEEIAKENGLLPGDEPEVKPPPRMAWVLVGIPVVRFGEIQDALEVIASVPDVTVLSTANDTTQD